MIYSTIKKIKDDFEGYYNDCQELRTVLSSFNLEFDNDAEELYLTDGGSSYYFDSMNTFALEQMCNLLKIKQFNFFNDLSPDLKIEIYGEQIKKIKPKKDQLLLKIRSGNNGKKYIRAMLPHDYETYNYVDLFDDLESIFDKNDIEAFHLVGFEHDTPALWLDIILKEKFEQNWYKGFAIKTSDLGDSKLEIYASIYNLNYEQRTIFKNEEGFQYNFREYVNMKNAINDTESHLNSKLNECREALKNFESNTFSSTDQILSFFNNLELKKTSPAGTLLKIKTPMLADLQKGSEIGLHDILDQVRVLVNDVKPSQRDNNYWRGKTFKKLVVLGQLAGSILEESLNG